MAGKDTPYLTVFLIFLLYAGEPARFREFYLSFYFCSSVLLVYFFSYTEVVIYVPLIALQKKRKQPSLKPGPNQRRENIYLSQTPSSPS